MLKQNYENNLQIIHREKFGRDELLLDSTVPVIRVLCIAGTDALTTRVG